jgi:hypothetical protein
MRLASWKTVPFACAMLALAACGSKGGEDAAAGKEGAAGADASASASASGMDAAGPMAGTSPEGTASPSATPAASKTAEAKPATKPAGDGDLSAYVGKWPFDAVNGIKWDDNPIVKAGIEKTVSDAAVRKAMTNLDGPSSPIEMYKGKVSSWSCEAHNCGDHQWNVMVDPKTGAADVCYHNEAKTPGQSRWFLASGKVDMRPGNCSTE